MVEKKEIISIDYFGFDINFLPKEDNIKFYNENYITIILNDGKEIIMNFKNFSYELDGKVCAFSPFHINFDFVKDIKFIFLPNFLEEKYKQACNEKRRLEVNRSKDYFRDKIDGAIE